MNKRSDAQWHALFEEHHDSSLSAAAFCRQHKLCAKYFSLRKKQLHWTVENTPTFVPVRVQSPTQISSQNIQLRWQSVELNLPSSLPAPWVAQLVKALI